MAPQKAKEEGHEESEDDSEDEWSEEEGTLTPIDAHDPFLIFAEGLKGLQLTNAARFQVATIPPCFHTIMKVAISSSMLRNPK